MNLCATQPRKWSRLPSVRAHTHATLEAAHGNPMEHVAITFAVAAPLLEMRHVGHKGSCSLLDRWPEPTQSFGRIMLQMTVTCERQDRETPRKKVRGLQLCSIEGRSSTPLFFDLPFSFLRPFSSIVCGTRAYRRPASPVRLHWRNIVCPGICQDKTFARAQWRRTICGRRRTEVASQVAHFPPG
jgi:hypothetical protein